MKGQNLYLTQVVTNTGHVIPSASPLNKFGMQLRTGLSQERAKNLHIIGLFWPAAWRFFVAALLRMTWRPIPHNLGYLLIILAVLALTGCDSPQSSAAEAKQAAPTVKVASTETQTQLVPTATVIPSSSTLTPAPTNTPQPASLPQPTFTPAQAPTSTPALRQLTTGGCCTQPFFSSDSQQVLFVDKPNPNAPDGIYGIEITGPRATPMLVNEIIGFRSPDRIIVATMNGDTAQFINESTGESWNIDTGGNWPRYSPDGTQILWAATDREGPYDRRRSDIWVANLDGGNPRLVISLIGGGFVDWLPDGQHILLLNRDNLNEEERTLFLYNLATDERLDLAREKRLREVELSPGGSWIVYFLTFADEPEKDGKWVVSTDGSQKHKLDTPGFGAYRWRDDQTLLFIPMRNSRQESMQLWTIDVASNQSQPLTYPASLSFSISNGDWDVSPDGRHIVFVNSAGQNVWLITLP